MKKVFLMLSAVCMVALTSCKEDAAAKINSDNVAAAAVRDAQASKYPVITFDKSEFDFGEIMNGTPVETVFSYTNTGDAPLVVTNIKSTCGCTVPQDWSKEPLAPGASDKFTVKFNGKGNGNTMKAITVTANTEKGSEVVKIKAFVKADPNKVAKKAASPVMASPVK